MLMAKNIRNEWVHAVTLQEKNKNDCYFCPDCNELVKLKIGQTKIKHFSHHKKCSNSSFSEGETIEHLMGKQVLYDIFTKKGFLVEMEPYLNSIKQRPDLLCYNAKGEKIAVEFQCSPISVKKLRERTKGYDSINCPVIWIVGNKNSNLKQFQFAYFKGDLVVFYLDVTYKKLFVKCSNKTYICENIFSKNSLAKVTTYQFQKKHVNEYNWYKNITKNFLKVLYQLRICINDIPKVLFLQNHQYSGIKNKFSECLVLVYSILMIGPLSFDACLKRVKIYINLEYIKLFDMPLVNYSHFIAVFVSNILTVLLQSQLIIFEDGMYMLKK